MVKSGVEIHQIVNLTKFFHEIKRKNGGINTLNCNIGGIVFRERKQIDTFRT